MILVVYVIRNAILNPELLTFVEKLYWFTTYPKI